MPTLGKGIALHTLIKRILIIALFTTDLYAGVIPKHRIPKNEDVIQVFDNAYKQVLPNNFNVVVWNMYKGKKDTWAADFRMLSENHDILITQEMFLKGEMKSIFERENGFEFSCATSFFFDGEDRTGVATISKFNSINQSFFRSKYREPIVRSPKMTLITKYALENGEELLVANIHAINFVVARKLEHQIKEVARAISEHDGPAIFAGDFNTWSRKKQRKMKQALREIGLTEVKYTEGPDNRMRIFGRVIDYLWYKNLRLTRARVLGSVTGADHIPMSHSFSVLDL